MIGTFSTLGCPEADLDGVVALARRHGLGAIELRALAGTVDLPAFLARTCGSPAGFAARIREAGVEVAALDTSFRLFGHGPEDREALLDFLPWAEALGGARLRIFDGESELGEGEWAAGLETLAWWQELRARNGWRSDLVIETHWSLVTGERIRSFLAAAPEGTSILWDTHHTWKVGREDPTVTWRAIAPSVVHLHVKDSVSRPSARHPFTYVLPGDGEFPFARLKEALVGDGFGGVVSLEWERMWHPYLPTLDEALEVAADRGWL